jgi:hypothetical protein
VNLDLIRDIIDETTGGINFAQTDDKCRIYGVIALDNHNEDALDFITNYIREQTNKQMKNFTNATKPNYETRKIRRNAEQLERNKRYEEGEAASCKELQKYYEEDLKKQQFYNEHSDEGYAKPFPYPANPPPPECDKYLKPSNNLNKRSNRTRNLSKRKNRTRKQRK